MLQESENGADENTSVSDILFEKFKLAHPHVNVGYSKQWYVTMKRIAAPTQPSLRGGSKISGQGLLLYRSKSGYHELETLPLKIYCIFCLLHFTSIMFACRYCVSKGFTSLWP